MIDKIKIINTDILSDDKYVLKKITYEYYKDDGKRYEKSSEVYHRGNAAVVLLYNKEQKTIILTKQFRLPSFLNGNKSGMLIEACAGMLDKDSPEDCARREVKEETGYKISDVQKVFEAYMSPGSVTELLYFFIAAYDKSMKVSEGGGVEDEEENIEVLEINIDKAMEMISKGEIRDAKTIMLLQYVKLNNIL